MGEPVNRDEDEEDSMSARDAIAGLIGGLC